MYKQVQNSRGAQAQGRACVDPERCQPEEGGDQTWTAMTDPTGEGETTGRRVSGTPAHSSQADLVIGAQLPVRCRTTACSSIGQRSWLQPEHGGSREVGIALSMTVVQRAGGPEPETRPHLPHAQKKSAT